MFCEQYFKSDSVKEVPKLMEKHKAALAHRFAYSLHQSLVCQVMEGNFQLPPRREEKSLRDDSVSTSASETEELRNEGLNEQSTTTTTTTTRTGTEMMTENNNNENNNNPNHQTSLEDSYTTKKLLQVLSQYEDFLVTKQQVGESKKLQAVREANMRFVRHVVGEKQEFMNLQRENIGIAIALLSAERTGMNKLLFLEFVTDVLMHKRISKISQIRKGRPYCLLQGIQNKIAII